MSYKSPDLPILMPVEYDGESWGAEISSRFVKCELEISVQQLPDCIGLSAGNAGMEPAPLAETFGEAP